MLIILISVLCMGSILCNRVENTDNGFPPDLRLCLVGRLYSNPLVPGSLL